MKIFIHDYGGYAFTRQLADVLASFGNKVIYSYSITTQAVQRAGLQNLNPNLLVKGIELSRSFEKYSYIQRRNCEIEHGQKLAGMIKQTRPDVVVSANTPLDAQNLALRASREVNARFIFWLQDAIGLATQKTLSAKIPLVGSLIGTFYSQLEKSMVKSSDRVILISRDFCSLMNSWGVEGNRICVLPNWAPLQDIPVNLKKNPWAVAHGLADKFVFLYSGILGLKHDPELFLKLAQSFSKNPEVRIVVIAEGGRVDWLKEQKSLLLLENLVLLPFQPTEVYPQVLGSADVLISILNADAGEYSVPSKVLSYLCAGRPVLLSAPPTNLASRIVQENHAGLVSSPLAADQWVENAQRVFSDGQLVQKMGVNARRYAESSFDINEISRQFIQIIT